jgi:hypothetical protein
MPTPISVILGPRSPSKIARCIIAHVSIAVSDLVQRRGLLSMERATHQAVDLDHARSTVRAPDADLPIATTVDIGLLLTDLA